MYYLKQQVIDTDRAPQAQPGLISAIIPVYQAKAAHLPKVIAAVEAQQDTSIEIIVVKNGKFETQLTSSCPMRVFEIDRNVGAAYARNLGAVQAAGEVLWFIDSDLEAIPARSAATAARMLKADNEIGIIGSIVFNTPEGEVMTIGRKRESSRCAEDETILDDDFANTACAFVRAETFFRIKGFADFIEYPFDDVDFGFKVRAAGLRCVGVRACAGTHPLHGGSNSVFHEFMSFHNMLLHFAISYRPSQFAALLQKKAGQGFRLAPPRVRPEPLQRALNLGRSAVGFALAAAYLLLHLPRVIRLRQTRQAMLRSVT
ncbi:MAG: glycosyltransferase family 2 protein [Bdellovibrionales bacterium]|nr:glycosyltransferase family 2 protein [Bdellovibrionales bacterium]